MFRSLACTIDVRICYRIINTVVWRRQSLDDGRRWRVFLPCCLPVLPLTFVQLGLMMTPFMLPAVARDAPHCHCRRRCRHLLGPPAFFPNNRASSHAPTHTDAQQQADELCALQAIFGEEFVQVRAATQSAMWMCTRPLLRHVQCTSAPLPQACVHFQLDPCCCKHRCWMRPHGA